MIGQILNNRYRITHRLGKGAMGIVYRATDSQTSQEVAVKVISSDLSLDPEVLERFKREGEALRKLKHPNIVGYLDAFQDGEQYVIVMEYVPGGSLHSLINKGGLPIEHATRIALGLCDALIRSHQLNIIHRDLKPENVLIAEDGTPKLADFGVARLNEGTRMTQSGTKVGTPYYMSPEAWEGKTLDAQSDIWSLGVMLFELLSGRVPFDGDTEPAVMTKVFNSSPPDLMKLRKGVPSGLVKIIERMLTREKVQRYQSMREVAVDLERGEPSIKTPAAKPAWSFPTGRNSVILMVSVLLIAFLAVINWVVLPLVREPTTTPESTATEVPSVDEPVLISPTLEPELGVGSTLVSEKDSMTMVFVPEGEFTMGSSPPDPSDNDKQSPSYFDNNPEHLVTLDSFWIDQTEVTNKQFALCVSAGKCNLPIATTSPTRSNYFGSQEFDNYPVIYINWNQAKSYCEWAGRRLPTEAEWEKAARGPNGNIYPWGNDEPNEDLLNFNSNTNDTTEVGSYVSGKSFYGAYDMAGNVWEWVSSLYLPYPYNFGDGREDQSATTGTVLRGGSWFFQEGSPRSIFRPGAIPAKDLVRSDIRSHSDPNTNQINTPHGFGTVGFRCAMSESASSAESSTANEIPWSGIISVRLPTLNQIRDELVSIWDANGLSVDDMLNPGIQSFTGSADSGQEYLWPVYWCAADRTTLDENVDNISTTFMVNGEVVPDEYIFSYYVDMENGWICNYRATVIGDLPESSSINLQVVRVLEADIFDGQTSYEQGSYTYELNVDVR